jgi:hypothetical protein
LAADGVNDKRPQGRPPIPADERLVVRSLRLTAEQWDKLARLGGVKWLRERINKAREATPSQYTVKVTGSGTASVKAGQLLRSDSVRRDIRVVKSIRERQGK